MNINVAFLIDTFDHIKPYKDSSVAMMLEAQRRNWTVHVFHQHQLKRLADGSIAADASRIRLQDTPDWVRVIDTHLVDLSQMHAVFMRKDPPMDMHYMYSTYLLELLEQRGVRVVNKPRSLRDVNEKLFITWFPQCCVETFVGAIHEDLKGFLEKHGDIIVKPLGAMGGTSVFRVRKDDPNTNVIFETLTDRGHTLTMAQRFIPQISEGDKRLILINGDPVPYALARIPKSGETRGNLAAGARAEGRPLSERDRWLCAQVAPVLREKGLYFVGLDVIGDYITEINVTSPTGIRELDKMFGLNIAGLLLDWLERDLAAK